MNGVAIIERTDNGTHGVFIDQETIECARLNARTQKRIQEAAMRQQMARRKEKHRKDYNRTAAKYVLLRCGILGASVWALATGFAHPVICFPVALYALCAVCVQLGAWFGRAAKK
jgi:hypothetical protein